MSEDNQLTKSQITERKWFVRTLIASLVSVIAYVGVGSARILAERGMAPLQSGIPFEALSDEQLDQFRIFSNAALLLFSSCGILLVISGSLFLVFLMRWLFAVRAKTKVETSHSK
jgi:hypothetical protein